VPLPALLPSFPELTRNFAAAEGATTLFLPDILPVSTRGVLPETIEDAVHGRQRPEHLTEWLRIVGRNNPAKNVIARYARLFSLRHYWRIVHARHQSAVRRSAARLMSAFAAFFRVSDDSIRRDLTLMARRLGKGWEKSERHRVVPAGCHNRVTTSLPEIGSLGHHCWEFKGPAPPGDQL
jgi:hypothetical protein